MSVFAVALSSIPDIKNADGFIQTEPFLDVCRLTIPVIEKLGTAFALVRTDVNGNIQRLADRAALDPGRYSRLFTIIQDEVVEKKHAGSSSCTKGLLWLKRAMEFTVAIMQRLTVDSTTPMDKVVSEVYTATLYQFHGFFTSSAFTLAFKFVPSREYFFKELGSPDTIMQEMAEFVSKFGAILNEIHQFLDENGLNDPTKV